MLDGRWDLGKWLGWDGSAAAWQILGSSRAADSCTRSQADTRHGRNKAAGPNSWQISVQLTFAVSKVAVPKDDRDDRA